MNFLSVSSPVTQLNDLFVTLPFNMQKKLVRKGDGEEFATFWYVRFKGGCSCTQGSAGCYNVVTNNESAVCERGNGARGNSKSLLHISKTCFAIE